MNIKFKDKEYKIEKKHLIIVMVVFLVLLVISLIIKTFSTTTLKCTKLGSNYTINSKTIYNASFKVGKLKKLVVYYQNKPTEEYQFMLDDIYTKYLDELEALEADGGYDFTIKKEPTYVEYEVTIELDKIPNTTEDKIGFSNRWTFKDFKNDLKTNGFTCK